MRSRFVLLFALLPSVGACRPAIPPAPAELVTRTCAAAEIRTVAAMRGPRRPDGHVADDDGTAMIHPCPADSSEAKAAAAAIETLRDRVYALAPDADPKPLSEELHALLSTQCFELTATEVPTFESALSLRSWWEAGGEEWLSHWLALDVERRIVVPPTPRHALTVERREAHPLAPLLCPASAVGMPAGVGCGFETLGWARRAERTFTRRVAGEHAKTEEACAAEAKREPPEDRYDALRRCVEPLAEARTSLPLGRFKAPSDGWLVLTGGGAPRCKTLRAYHLASGAAYAASDCASAGPTTTVRTSRGRVPLAAIREAAWMLMLAGTAESDVRTAAASFAVPPDIAIESPAHSASGFGSVRCGGVGGQLRDWSWVRAGSAGLRGQAGGRIRWPSGCTEAEEHAAELLAIAEEAFEAGCAPAPPPQRIPWGAPGAALPRAAPPTLDDPAFAGARNAFATLTTTAATCPRLP